MSNIAHTYYPQSGRLVVLGAGESGVVTAIVCKDRCVDVFVSDLGDIPTNTQQHMEPEKTACQSDQHTESLIMNDELVVQGPGIPEKATFIHHRRRSGQPVISQIEFAAQYTDAKLICLTSSAGKSTTSLQT